MLLVKPFKTLQIDAEKGICLLDGEEVQYVNHLCLEFRDGTWLLNITKDEFYSQTLGEKAAERR